MRKLYDINETVCQPDTKEYSWEYYDMFNSDNHNGNIDNMYKNTDLHVEILNNIWNNNVG